MIKFIGKVVYDKIPVFNSVTTLKPENTIDNHSVVTGELFDILGMSITRIEIKNNKAPFSAAGLRKGIYIFKDLY